MAQSDIASAFAANPEGHKVNAYPWFDWLRFALASMVVLDHSGFRPLPFLDGSGSVKVFFALSGWLIGGILLRTEKAELPRFFFNRATRIWIPYAVAILLLYSVAVVKEGVDYFWLKYLFLDTTFTHQLFTVFPRALYELPMDGSGNQFWSIAVEEQFYLFAPLAMLFLPRGKTILLWGPLALLTMLLDWNAASVSLGVCAAILERDFQITQRSFVRPLALVVAAGAAIAITIGESEYVAGPLFAVALVILLAVPGKRSSVALIAGGLSYPLYLNQWIAAFAVHFVEKRGFPLNPVISISLIYFASVVMALCMYWMIDRQVQLRRNGWYTPALGRRLGIAAYTLVALGIIGGGLMHLYGPQGAPRPGEVPPVIQDMK